MKRKPNTNNANWTGPTRDAWEALMSVKPAPSFLERLEPELTLQDLENRAAKAYEIARAAQAAGDTDKLGRAVERLLQRWQQWEDLAPPAFKTPHVYTARANQVCDLLEPMAGGDALSRRLLEAMYFFGSRSEGTPTNMARAIARAQVEAFESAAPPAPGRSRSGGAASSVGNRSASAVEA